ncbi:prolyl oligopeptidase family serine peptidase [Streptomyces sp. CoH17]|uniref:prolyl oligopeptidase family serine peptidase n=1 Tax=Streptomyces sp. CoH17 TaxID=2992806 RepID=UPI00226DD050
MCSPAEVSPVPNPRGSAGRGQEFVRLVVRDLGGTDRHGILSGIDHLVAAGIANPARVGLMGGSTASGHDVDRR